MAYISKEEYSKVKGYIPFNFDFHDQADNALVSWEACKWLVSDKSFYLYGKPKKFGSSANDKLPEWAYIEFHSATYTYKKQPKEPSEFEKLLLEIVKEFDTEKVYSGSFFVAPAVASTKEFLQQQIQFTEVQSDLVFPEFTVTGYSNSGGGKSYGMTPDQKLEWLSKQLKIDDPTKADLVTISAVIDDMLPAKSKETFLQLVNVILG